jgi:hypothetical protein
MVIYQSFIDSVMIEVYRSFIGNVEVAIYRSFMINVMTSIIHGWCNDRHLDCSYDSNISIIQHQEQLARCDPRTCSSFPDCTYLTIFLSQEILNFALKKIKVTEEKLSLPSCTDPPMTERERARDHNWTSPASHLTALVHHEASLWRETGLRKELVAL